MMKKYRRTLMVTSIFTLLPMLIGILLWGQLPAEMATHFGINNVPNGWSSKTFTVFGMPLFLLVIHWVCFFVTVNDPKSSKISEKMFRIILWICPVISFVVIFAIYGYALKMPIDQGILAHITMAVMFLIVGNYMPKCRQNYTVGIKLPWTLADEDNWNRTHRLAGKVWMVTGIICLLFMFWENEFVLIGLILVAVFIPVLYSFGLYKGWIK